MASLWMLLFSILLPFGSHAAAPAAPKNVAPAAPSVVQLQLLNKVTARSSTMDATLMQPVFFGTLSITAKACWVAPKEAKAEQAALLEIEDSTAPEPEKIVFSGWMFASSPALSAMEHAVYDVGVIGCK